MTGWIDKIADGIEKIMGFTRIPLVPIPAVLLLCELKNRPGLSAIALTTSIIKRLAEAGIETGVNPDGSPNIINQFVRIMSEEIIKEFKENAQVNIASGPGSVVSMGTGGNAGGQVTIVSSNIAPFGMLGLIR